MKKSVAASTACLLLRAFALRTFSTTPFNNRYPVILGLVEMLVLLVVLPLAVVLQRCEGKSRATVFSVLFATCYTAFFLALCIKGGFFFSPSWDFEAYFQGVKNLHSRRGNSYNVLGNINFLNFLAMNRPLFHVTLPAARRRSLHEAGLFSGNVKRSERLAHAVQAPDNLRTRQGRYPYGTA